jgi:hypothetical protein
MFKKKKKLDMAHPTKGPPLLSGQISEAQR